MAFSEHDAILIVPSYPLSAGEWWQVQGKTRPAIRSRTDSGPVNDSWRRLGGLGYNDDVHVHYTAAAVSLAPKLG